MTNELLEEFSKTIKPLIEEMASVNGYELTDNVDRIIRAKLKFFGIDSWKKCPCVRDNAHSCISAACQKQIEETGVCHCNLFKKSKKVN